MEYLKLIIHTDGGSRGNPGPAAIGVVIETENPSSLVVEYGTKIGEATNNTAEYNAVLSAFEYLVNHQIHAKQIEVFLDSQVVARQLAGEYKITKAHLSVLCIHVKKLETRVAQQVVYKTIPREQNTQADALLNRALDGLK